jgi:hypothetical protein
MHAIALSDPAWQTTFPHRVAPGPDEWLAGLLLRCDEVNGWDGGTTATHLLRVVKNHDATTHFNVLTPSASLLQHLSQLLAVPTSSLVATTYQSEMDRFAGVVPRLLLQTNVSLRLSLCPQCLAHARMLTRLLLLPQIMVCLEHQLLLQTRCQCGVELRLFSQHTLPFTCAACGLDWGELPRIKASRDHLELAQQLMSYYAFFLSKGTPELLIRALSLLEERKRERGKKRLPLLDQARQARPSSRRLPLGAMWLEDVIYSLLCFNLSPDDIMTDADHSSGEVFMLG